MRALRFPFLFLLLLTFSLNLFAEDREKQTGPKVGLVLAGGGALGFAHVGVIKVLQEENIPIHMVAGTSMGAIVGAAYAAGRTPEEMEEVLTTTDWDALFDETVPRTELPYRMKAGREREILGSGKLGFKDGKAVAARGVVQGQKVRLLLQRLYDGVPTPVNFDDMPVPFRGVIADLGTGEAIVPESGNLSTLVRASMSVPGFLAPVQVGDRWMVDGGIANNLPVDVVLGMGADVLIVVELYADLADPEELTSPLSITGQITSLLLAQNAAIQKQKMRAQDVFVAPDLTGYSSVDFAKSKELMDIGEAKAREVVKELRKFSISQDAFAKYEQARTGSKVVPQTIDFIRVNNDSRIPTKKIESHIHTKVGDTFDRDKVEAEVGEIHDMGYFKQVRYDVVEENGQTGLVVTTEPKAWIDKYMRFGFSIEDDFKGETTYRIAAALRNEGLNKYGAYSEIGVELGKFPGFNAELYQPLGMDSPYFVAPKVEFLRNTINFHEGGDVVAEYFRKEGVGEIAFGREVAHYGEFRFGYRRGFGETELDIGDPRLPEDSYDIGQAYGGVVVDTLDQADFPTKGFLGILGYSGSFEELGDSDEFNTVFGELGIPYTFGQNTLTFSGDFGVTFQERPPERSYTLGGFLDVSGFQQNDLLASDFGIARLIYTRRIAEGGMPIFKYGFYAGGSAEFTAIRNDDEERLDDMDIWGGSLFLGVDTPIIPAYFAFGYNDENESSVYFVLGRLSPPRR